MNWNRFPTNRTEPNRGNPDFRRANFLPLSRNAAKVDLELILVFFDFLRDAMNALSRSSSGRWWLAFGVMYFFNPVPTQVPPTAPSLCS